jgi:hypothetical protein
MNIKLLDDPFPHVLIENFYSERELVLILEEIKFLSHPNKLYKPGVHHASNSELTESRALHLEKSYAMPELSNILQVTKKTLDTPFISTIVNKWPHLLRLRYVNMIITKLRYYHNGEGYQPHTDVGHEFLTFSYFHTTPKKFSGGELYFPQYKYQVECSHNTFILLPGYVEHGVKKVSINDDAYWNGDGRYCISQFMSVKNSDNYV